MSLTKFNKVVSNSYQEDFYKKVVSPEICSTKWKEQLKYGESIERPYLDLSNVSVRATVKNSASTIDDVLDGSEFLTVNLSFETAVGIHDDDVKQASNLKPIEKIGSQLGKKIRVHLDGSVLKEIKNAYQTFDTGDLTNLISTGVPMELNTTNVPKMSSMMMAKLRGADIDIEEYTMCFVGDALALALIEQYLQSKATDNAANIFANGYKGKLAMGRIYTSENLTGEAVLSMATQPTDGDTVVINGITFTFKTVLGAVAGNVLIGGSADVARANLAALINSPSTTTANGVALSAANIKKISETLRIAATNDNTANTMTIVGTGSGRLAVSETFTDGTDAWTANFIHCYYGVQGEGIDLVVQDLTEVDIRENSDRRSSNIFANYLAGVKVFIDGARKFLDVWVKVS